MSDAARWTVERVELRTRPVRFRLPFGFGGIRLVEARQLFLFALLRREGDGARVTGASADLLLPRWLDKRSGVAADRALRELLGMLRLVREVAPGLEPGTIFDLATDMGRCLLQRADRARVPRLVASFAGAQFERALTDALCRLEGIAMFEAVRRNRLGIDGRRTPDLADFDLAGFLAGLRPRRRIWLRHTVGLEDPLEDERAPGSLVRVIAETAPRFFKIKLRGEVEADLARIERVAAVLDRRVAPYAITLDGNEAFDPQTLGAFLEGLLASRRLERLRASLLYLEQPVPRELTETAGLAAVSAPLALVLDEGDGDDDAFPRAFAHGWRGVTVKAAKGFFRALLNAARVARWNREAGQRRAFLTSEDLTTQPGLALQQDLALAALLGCVHSERNGHHFTGDMQGAPAEEKRAFAAHHPDLYRLCEGRIELRIRLGRLELGSLDCPGFAAAVLPDRAWMDPLENEV